MSRDDGNDRDADVRRTGAHRLLRDSDRVQPALPASATELEEDEVFDRVVGAQVQGAPLTQVRVVDDTGAVLYATDAGPAGRRVVLSAAELQAVRTTGVTASRDGGVDATRLDGGQSGQSLDVSARLRAPSGQPLLLQTRQPYQVVWLTSMAVWLTMLPSLLLALGLLYLMKIVHLPPDAQPLRGPGGARTALRHRSRSRLRDRPFRRLSTETKASTKTTELIVFVVMVIAVIAASAVIAVIATANFYDGDAGSTGGDTFGATTSMPYVVYLTIAYLVSRGLAKSGSHENYTA